MNPNTERDERVKEIRERLETVRYSPMFAKSAVVTMESYQAALRDVDTLLSLLGSQAVGDVAKERNDWKAFAEECKEGIRASHRMLDELGVPREDAWLQETDGENYGIEEVVEYPVHERIKMLPPFVATRMRDRCVQKVRELRDGWQADADARRDPDNPHDYKGSYGLASGAVDACDDIITALQSLTLEGEQEKSK